MVTYKKQLKDSNGDNIYPVLGTGTVAYDKVNFDTFPDTCKGPVLVAKGARTSTTVSGTGSAKTVPFSSVGITEPKYASAVSTTDILLQPGCYSAIARMRFSDYSGDHTCYMGVYADGDLDLNADIDRGSWVFSTLRLTVETKRVFKITSPQKIRFYVINNGTTGIDSGVMWIFRIPNYEEQS